MERQLRCFNRLAPDLRKVHPLTAWSPQECTEVMAHVFQSLRFNSTYHIPSYRTWLHEHGYLSSYRFHKRFLQHLQYQQSRRLWVLKSPDHVFALNELLSVYPDARIVFLHRDPLKVIPSNAQLIEILRAPFAARIDRQEIGRELMADMAASADNMIGATRLQRLPSSQLFHLQFVDLVSRPLDSIRRLYRHFGLSLRASATERIARKIARQPKGGYGHNTYSFERHNIDPDEVAAKFDHYVSYFDIQQEHVDPTQARTKRIVSMSAKQPEYSYR